MLLEQQLSIQDYYDKLKEKKSIITILIKDITLINNKKDTLYHLIISYHFYIYFYFSIFQVF